MHQLVDREPAAPIRDRDDDPIDAVTRDELADLARLAEHARVVRRECS